MAEESGQEKSLNELKQEIAHSRDWLARDLGGLRYELDFPLKFRQLVPAANCWSGSRPRW